MDDELASLRQAIAEAKAEVLEQRRLQEERQARWKEEQARWEEEQAQRERELARREVELALREQAGRISERLQPQSLMPYLEACHSLSLSLQVVTGRSSPTQKSDPADPVGRIYPRRIIPWDDFPARQEEMWDQLSEPSFTSQRQFPSRAELDHVRSVTRPVGSEQGVRDFERTAVENAVSKLIGAVKDNLVLRDRLGLRGTVTFESDPEGNGNRAADHFCIYGTSDGTEMRKTVIEFKAPDKVAADELSMGLASEIWPDRDVINKDGEEEDFAFESRALAAAVVTQLFSHMISLGIQYGYVSTGQAYVFLYIPDDPSMVYCHLSVPILDVADDNDDNDDEDDDETRLHRTAVAQVFAFILQALRAQPPPQAWHDAAASLDIWAVNDDDDEDAPPSPTMDRSTRSGKKPATSSSSVSSGNRGRDGAAAARTRIQDRPYCTHHCLLGLARGGGGPIDESCPNAGSHGARHMGRAEFMALVRAQLAEDRGPDADAVPLYLSGSVGALLKIRLSAFGYTFVAKGVEGPNRKRLQHEENMYNHLRSIQGAHVPVCLGLTNLSLPYYYNGRVLRHLLLLSWAGQPLHRYTNQLDKTRVMVDVATAFARLHRLQVLHGDAEARNIAYDKGPMIVDLERAKLCAHEPLGSISPDSQGRERRRKRNMSQEQGDDPFGTELRSVVESVWRCFGAAATVPRGLDFFTNNVYAQQALEKYTLEMESRDGIDEAGGAA